MPAEPLAPDPAPLPWRQRGAPLLLGHRGAPRQALENSRAALDAALDAWLDGVETDLQRAKDGALLLHHDPHLAGGESIAALSEAEVLRLAPETIGLAQLRELLEQRPEALVNLEVKTDAPHGDARAAELAVQLQAWPAALRERLWLSSFDPLLLLRLAEAEVPVPLAFLASQASALRLLPCLPVAAVHPHHSLVTAERLRGWHEAGLAVFAWTVNSLELAAELLELGVDGLIGDEPSVLLTAAGRA
ncbi:MAG: glycerophosphodiester phosphodiesterase [Deinococcales bacterium]|nr:glycerophosphodiester phosphodiesterase [Deinococcales bacterium]